MCECVWRVCTRGASVLQGGPRHPTSPSSSSCMVCVLCASICVIYSQYSSDSPPPQPSKTLPKTHISPPQSAPFLPQASKHRSVLDSCAHITSNTTTSISPHTHLDRKLVRSHPLCAHTPHKHFKDKLRARVCTRRLSLVCVCVAFSVSGSRSKRACRFVVL